MSRCGKHLLIVLVKKKHRRNFQRATKFELINIANILITGTDGFIGGILKESLVKAGHQVFGTTFFREPGSDEIKFDIQKDGEIAKLPDRSFDVLVHTIAVVDQTAPLDLARQVNTEGTRKMVEWAKKHGVKHFILTSSMAVYGKKMMGENLPETTARTSKGSPYEITKAEAEQIVEESQIGYSILRFPSLVGPNDTFLTPIVLPRLLNGTFYFTGKKDRLFSALYVRNLGPIITAIIEKGSQNAAFNCTDYTVKFRELIEEYAHQLGIAMPTATKSIIGGALHSGNWQEALLMVYSYFGASYNNDRLVKTIGLENMTQFKWQDGVREAIDAFFKKHPEVGDPRKAK